MGAALKARRAAQTSIFIQSTRAACCRRACPRVPRGAFLKITDKKQFFAGYSVIKVAKPLRRGRTDSSLRQGGKPQSASSSSSGPLISLTVDSTSFLVFIFIRPIFISGVHASTTEESATSTMCARKMFSEA